MPIGIIYSLAQNLRREVIITTGSIDTHKARVQPGEGWLDITDEEYATCGEYFTLDALVSEKLGYVEPQSDNCVVVDANDIVVVAVKADPRIDDHPDGFLIQDDGYVGEVYDLNNGAP